jgi:cytochrome c oxidase subunit II
MYSTTGTEASNFVNSYNIAFYSIAGVSLLLLVFLTVLMLYFVFRYNNKKNKTAVQNEGNVKLEIVWTVTPVILVLVMFYYGWSGWEPMSKAPKDSLNVTSVARMWSFSFIYENGKQSKDLVIPVNTPVQIKLTSLDVIHSLFIPAFRVKSDMIPGREKMMWFRPQEVGEFDLYCAEYCGLRHSYMNSNVKVLSLEDYNKWYADSVPAAATAEAGTASPGSAGFKILVDQGCNACHTTDGTRLVGPSYKNLFGEKQTVIREGKEVVVTADEAYIKKAILEPNSEIVKGYPKDLMQSYKGILTDDDIAKIIEYMKSLHEK